jgi:cytochrome c oxidase assembly factor CtaG
VWVLVYYGWHVPALYDAAVRHDVVHALEHATMFGAGLALWIGLLGPLPKPAWFGNAAGLAYVIAVRMAGAVIANVLLWSSTPYYRVYEGVAGVDAAEDQSLAGAIWMIEGSVVTIGVLGWLFVRWMTQGEEAQELVEHAARHGVQLDPARARRAVAAGYGERLRRRLEHGAGEQDEADEDGDDDDDVDQEAERLRLGAEGVDHKM